MNRNNGREIGERLNLLRDYIIQNADKTHAVKVEELRIHLANAGFEGQNGVALNIKTVYRDLTNSQPILAPTPPPALLPSSRPSPSPTATHWRG